MRPFSHPHTFATLSQRLAACICMLLLLLAATGCSRRESVTVQIDVSKSLAISGKARSHGDGPPVAPSAFTFAAAIDSTLARAIDSDEFRALPISARFAKDDTAKHTRLLAALADMCSCSVRADPPAIRITVAASDHKEAAAIAGVIGKAMRESATTSAATALILRRAIENEALSLLNEHAKELQDHLERLLSDTGAGANDAAGAPSGHARDLAEFWSHHEMLSRELQRARAEAESLRTTIHSFMALSGAANESASFWIVPPNAQINAGWTAFPKLGRNVALFAVTNPAKGSDWLAAALSETNHTLGAAVDESVIATTSWFKTLSRPAKTSQDGKPSTPDNAAAISDLSSRITLTPIGDGSIIALGLSGTFSPEDRRTILDALTRCIQAKKRADISIDSLNRRDPISQRIATLDEQLHVLEPAFRSLARRTGATRETIGPLYESSQEGQAIERLAAAREALDQERKSIELHANPCFDDVSLMRPVLPPE